MELETRWSVVAVLALASALTLVGACLGAFRTLSMFTAQAAELAAALTLDAPGPERIAPIRELRAEVPEPSLPARETATRIPLSEPVSAAHQGPADERALSSLRTCATRDVRIVASVVNTVHPERSFAAIRHEGATRLVTLGARSNRLQLLALSPTYARIRIGEAAPCTLPVFLPPAERVEHVRAEPTLIELDLRRSVLDRSPDSLLDHVRHVGGSRYVVSPKLLPRVLANPRAAGRGSRLRKLERHGQQIGFEVARLRKRSLLFSLGLREGDVVRAINGRPLLGIDELLEGMHQLHQGLPVTLSVMRNNIPQNLVYSMQ